jgi:tetratricopeptide (TPR) repeat protein
MAMRKHPGVTAVAVAWALWGAVACLAQNAPAADPQSPPAADPQSPSAVGPAPCSVAPQPEPCGSKPGASAKPNTAEKFPFPGEVIGASSSAPAVGAATPNLSGVPDAPDTSGTPSAPLGKQDASKAFPFPGDVSKPGSGTNEPGTSSSSSSNSDDDATPAGAGATPALQDKGSEGSAATPGRHLLHRVNPVGTKLESADEREAEDLDVAHTYLGVGNLQGAYMRTQDAVKTAPDDPDAHFALAEIAQKLEKRDEAITEYNTCLKLDPPEKEAKDARKALERLKP